MQLMKHLLHQLETRFNSVTPLNRLPSEILLHVFAILQQDNYDIFTSFPPIFSGSYESAYSLIPVTGVCRLWRTLALAKRSLWKCWKVPRFTVGALTLAQEIFRRSDPIPFQLQLLNSGNITNPRIIEAGEQLARLLGQAPQRIHAIYVDHLQSIEFLDPLAKNLHNLEILHLRHIYWNDDENPEIEPIFLDELDSPNLKRLSFDSFTSLPCRWLTRLTHLSLGKQLLPILFEDFLDYLEALPNLQQLRFQEAGPSGPDSFPLPYPQANLRRIPLKFLRSFSQLSISASEYPLYLLHNLHTPSLTTIRWDHRSTNILAEDPPIADAMTPWKLPPSALLQNLTRVVMRSGTKHLYEVCEETMYLDDIPWYDPGFLPPSWLPGFLPNAQSLVITWENIMDNYGELLRGFSALSSLECRLRSVDPFFFEALAREKGPMLPHLKQLTLWHDPLEEDFGPSQGFEGALDEMFSEELSNALLTSRVAVWGRNTASTFMVRLELGNIDERWEWRDAFLESLIPDLNLAAYA